MKLFKDISFWCIVLTIVVFMVVHHFLSKGQLIEGNTNDEKCGAGSDPYIPCCWYNMWQDVEGTESQPHGTLNAEENLKTDGTVYLPLSMSGGKPTPEERTKGTWQECQKRCIDTPGCVYFNSFPDGSCFITDGRDGEQIGINRNTGGPSEDSTEKPTHSGRALALRENIPETQRTGLNQCKCAAAGEEPDDGWSETGALIDQSALQYGNNRSGSDVDCESNPEDSSCDAYGQSIPSTVDPAQATHFRCLIKSEVDGHLSDKATNLGMDISGFDSNSDDFQSSIRGAMLNHISIRKSQNPPLEENASQSDLDAAIARDIALRDKYNCPMDSCRHTELQQKKLALRAEYNLDVDASEDELDRAIDMRSDILSQYGIEGSDTWESDLAAAMSAQNASMIEMDRVKYCGNTDCDSTTLAEAKETWNSQRRQYNLPRDATSEELQAAIEAANLYNFIDEGESFVFNNCGKIGFNGPTLNNCISEYGANIPSDDTNYFNVIGEGKVNGIQLWTVPTTGIYDIEAFGACEGYCNGRGTAGFGKGAHVQARFTLNKGDKYMILVGQKGTPGNTSGGWQSAGGGGGTFMVRGEVPGDATLGDVLIVAGGGGGSVNASGNSTTDPGQDGGNANINDTSGGAGAGNGAGAGGGFAANGSGWINSYGKAFKTSGQGGNAWNATSWGSARCIEKREALQALGDDNQQYNSIISGEVNGSSICHGLGHGGFGGGGGGGGNPGGGGGGISGGDYGAISSGSGYNHGGRGGSSHINLSLAETSSEIFHDSDNTEHGSLKVTLISKSSNQGGDSDTSTGQYSDTITLPMPQEPTTSQASGGSVDCSDKVFLGVADTIRHNGHNSSWGNSMIASQGNINGDEGIKCDDYYYYKPNTISDLETDKGGGWSNSVREDGEAEAGFYTLQNSGISGGNQCTNWSVRVNHSSKVNYTCSDQGPKELTDPNFGAAGAILQGLGSSLDPGSPLDSDSSLDSHSSLDSGSPLDSDSSLDSGSPLDSEEEYTITTCGISGMNPPTASACSSLTIPNKSSVHSYSDGIHTFTFPSNGVYSIEVAGGAGGYPKDSLTLTSDSAHPHGHGAILKGNFTFSQNDQVKLLVGQKGIENTKGNTANGGGGGGGGSFVWKESSGRSNATLLIAAGGGGGRAIHNHSLYGGGENGSLGEDGTMGIPVYRSPSGKSLPNLDTSERSTYKGVPGTGGEDGTAPSGKIAKGWRSIVTSRSMNGETRNNGNGSGFGGGGCSSNHAGGGGGGYSGGGIFNYRGGAPDKSCRTGTEQRCTDTLGGGGGGSYFNTTENGGSGRVDSSDSSIGYNDGNGYIKIIGPL